MLWMLWRPGEAQKCLAVHASFHLDIRIIQYNKPYNSSNFGALSWFSNISIPLWGLKKGFLHLQVLPKMSDLRQRVRRGDLSLYNLQTSKNEWTWFRVGLYGIYQGKMHSSLRLLMTLIVQTTAVSPCFKAPMPAKTLCRRLAFHIQCGDQQRLQRWKYCVQSKATKMTDGWQDLAGQQSTQFSYRKDET